MGLAEGLHLQPAAKDGVIELHRLAGVVSEAQVRVQFGCHVVSFERAKLLAETGRGANDSTFVLGGKVHRWPAGQSRLPQMAWRNPPKKRCQARSGASGLTPFFRELFFDDDARRDCPVPAGRRAGCYRNSSPITSRGRDFLSASITPRMRSFSSRAKRARRINPLSLALGASACSMYSSACSATSISAVFEALVSVRAALRKSGSYGRSGKSSRASNSSPRSRSQIASLP